MDAVLSLRSKGLVMPILDGPPAIACYQHLKNIPLGATNADGELGLPDSRRRGVQAE